MLLGRAKPTLPARPPLPDALGTCGCGRVRNCLLLLLPVGLMGGLLGWWVRHLLEQRQRRKMREILQQEAQRPFSSDVGKAG